MRQNQKRNRGVAVRERAAVLGEKTESFTCCFCAVKKISAAGSLLQKHRKPRELRGRRKERWTKEGLYLFREKLWTARMTWVGSDLWLGRIRGQQVVS
jgi:hypothetical protein